MAFIYGPSKAYKNTDVVQGEFEFATTDLYC